LERSFALAPMSRAIAILTVVLWGVPALFLGLAGAGAAPLFLGGVGCLVAGVYGAVWIWWRPSRFVLRSAGLEVEFPGRRAEIPAHDITGARLLGADEFRREFGRALRVGAGGLWGGFGWLWTQRGGWVEFYVSRTDGFVLVERRSGTPLLVTPEDPEGLVEALRVQQRRP
jgi:hypothetical protein